MIVAIAGAFSGGVAAQLALRAAVAGVLRLVGECAFPLCRVLTMSGCEFGDEGMRGVRPA